MTQSSVEVRISIRHPKHLALLSLLEVPIEHELPPIVQDSQVALLLLEFHQIQCCGSSVSDKTVAVPLLRHLTFWGKQIVLHKQ
jgi:hypothetical protein